MSLYHGYVGARRCTGSATPGCVALMSWFLAAYHGKGARNDGIYNCRHIRGSSTTTSLHGEGRAADLGCHDGDAWAGRLADILRTHSAELGVQCIIYRRRIWSGAYPTSGWRPYHGTDAHTTHLHVELGWHAARHLTVKRIRAVLGDKAPKPDPDAYGGRPISQGAQGNRVRRIQRVVGTKTDGKFGSHTESAVRHFQRQHGLQADGVVGPHTWKAIVRKEHKRG